MMRISFNSIAFKTLFLLFSASTIFIVFIIYEAKHSFTQGYNRLIKEDISSIQNSIAPSISLNLSYGFNDAINEICNTQLENNKILLIKIKSANITKDLVFSNTNKSLKELEKEKHFISKKSLIDPSTSKKNGELTLVYSNKIYKENMQDFYTWFGISVIIFTLAILLLGFLLYNSLKNITSLAMLFEKFNPNKPTNFSFNVKANDEIGIINKSANTMVTKLTKYINKANRLNEEIASKEAHLREAQRIARVGSWEYSIIDKTLHLSDEVYRILEINLNHQLSWDEFMNFIADEEHSKVTQVINQAISEGSTFDLKYTLELKSKKRIHVQTKGKVRKKENGQIKITAVTMDITKDVENKKTIEQLAFYDTLTGLANRALLKNRMHKAIQRAKRDETNLAVLFLDLDHFKLINDTLGHGVGDELLVHISQILKENIRESDTLSRLGGDEFIILIPSIDSIYNIKHIVSNILKALQQKHYIGLHELYITSSIGIAIYPKDGTTAQDLIKNADTAMYEAKKHGRNNYQFYSPEMGNSVDNKLSIEQDLIQAIRTKEQIEVFYQAKVDAQNNNISGAEALVRWRHPQKGLIYPDDFIYIAESTGLMIELGHIIIEEAIFQLQECNKIGLVGLKIAINLSPRQFQDTNLISFIASMVEKYDIDSHQLEFEITETLSMSNMDNTLRILNELKAIGVSIAIDDFGTGHSSLAYLKKFPVNILKIDKSFVIDIVKDEEDRIIAQTIISMAHSLGFDTVAEGVETKEHVDILHNMDCDIFQGYHFSKPIPKDEFIRFLKEYKADNNQL
jgi:diguanylate cyclase (GGDEF)-like protein